jgi:hypothetical protein
MQGSWKSNQIHVGPYPAWKRSDASFDSNGNLTITNVVTNSGAGNNATMAMSISAAGLITSSGAPSLYGKMSADKKQLILTYTNGDGTLGMMLLTRTNGSTAFSNADLGGSWRANQLSVSNSLNGVTRWGRALLVSDISGNVAVKSIIQSNGTLPDGTVTAAVGSAGGVTMAGTYFSGIMSIDKKLIVGTSTEGDGNLSLYIYVK